MARTKPSAALPITPEGYAYDDLLGLADTSLRAGLSVLMRGHPGVGKSTLAAQLAERLGLPMEDIRLAQREPADLGGVYFPDRERQVLELFPPDWVRRVCREPTLVFLDEINAAVTRLHQAAAYQIVLERRVGPFRFHPDTRVLAAGNLEEDNAIVTPLSTALANRFAHFVLRVDADAWLTWAATEGVHPTVMAYIARHREEALYANEGDLAFPSPRSWAMASTLLHAAPPAQARRLVAACVGERAAEQLAAFERIFARVPVAAIVRKGRAMDFRRGKQAEPSFIYAAVFAVARWLCSEPAIPDEQLSNVVKFACSPGLDPEYVFLFLRQLKAVPGLLGRLQAEAEFRDLAKSMVDLRLEAWA